MSAVIDNSFCPTCEAEPGEDCRPDYDGIHSSRLREFVNNGSYLTRREAHMQMHAGMKAAGLNINERVSIFLTDEEVIGIYGMEGT